MANPFLRLLQGGAQNSGDTLVSRVTEPGDHEFSQANFDSQAQFPAAAAQYDLLSNQQRADKTISLLNQLGIEPPDDLTQIRDQGFIEDKPGLFERILIGLDAPRAAISFGIQDILTGSSSSPDFGDYLDAAFGRTDIEEQRDEFGFSSSGSDLLKNIGVEEADTGFGKFVRGVAHFGVDVLLDPLTYVTFGASAVGKKALAATGEATIKRLATSDNVLKLLNEGADTATEKYVKRYADEAAERLQKRTRNTGIELDNEEFIEQITNEVQKNLQDDILAPLISRNFAGLPEEVLQELPAFARGGARISLPFTHKQLSHGLMIPGTRGLGRQVLGDPVRKVAQKFGERTNTGAWLSNVLETASNNLDIDRALLRGVSSGRIKGHQYAQITSSLERATREAQLTNHAAFINQRATELQDEFKELGLSPDDLNKIAWQFSAEDGQRALNLATDIFREKGLEVGTAAGPTMQRVLGFAQWVSDTQSKLWEQYSKLDPSVGKKMQEFYMALAYEPKHGMETLQLLAERGIVPPKEDVSYGAEMVRQLLNSIGSGGHVEASIGSTSHALSRQFFKSPVVNMVDENPLVAFIEKSALDPYNTATAGGLSDRLKAAVGEIDSGRFLSAVDVNDQIEGVIEEMMQRASAEGVASFNKEATGRIFQEDPFQSVFDYIRELNNAVTYRTLINDLENIGLIMSKPTQRDFQATLAQMSERLKQQLDSEVLEKEMMDRSVAISPAREKRMRRNLARRRAERKKYATADWSKPRDRIKYGVSDKDQVGNPRIWNEDAVGTYHVGAIYDPTTRSFSWVEASDLGSNDFRLQDYESLFDEGMDAQQNAMISFSQDPRGVTSMQVQIPRDALRGADASDNLKELINYATAQGASHVDVTPWNSSRSIRLDIGDASQEITEEFLQREGLTLAKAIEKRIVDAPQDQKAATIDFLSETYGKEEVAHILNTTVPLIEFNKAVDELYDIVDIFKGKDGVRKTIKINEIANMIDDPDELQALLEQGVDDILIQHARELAREIGIDPKTFDIVYSGEVRRSGFVNPYLFNVGGKALENKQVQRDVGKWMEQLVNNMQAAYTPLGIAQMKAVNNQIVSWWKGMATITRPTFHVRNFLGAAWNNQIVGVRMQDYAMIRNNMIKLRKAMRNQTFDQALESAVSDPKARRVLSHAFDTGLMDASFTRAEYRTVRDADRTALRQVVGLFNPFDPEEFGLVRGGAFFMESIEDFMRMSAFARWIDTSSDEAAAATAQVAKEMAIGVHFDYSHLTEFETSIKQFVPFFVWIRRNLPLQLQTMIERPGLATRYMHIMDAVDEATGENIRQDNYPTPEYWSAQVAGTNVVLHEGTPFWARVMFDPDIPLKDLLEIDPMDPAGAADHFLSMLGPQFTTIWDLREQAQYGDVNAPAPLKLVAQQLAAFGLFDDLTEEGDWRIPYSARTLYNLTFPFAQEVVEAPLGPSDPRQQAALGDTPNDQNLLRRLGLQAARGVGVQLQTPQQTRSPAFEANDFISSVLQSATLNSGITPEDKDEIDSRYRGFSSNR